MTKTELCRRAALAALLAVALAVALAGAHEVRAEDGDKITVNGLHTFNGVSPHSVGPAAAPAPARTADPGRLRLRAARPAGE